MRYQELRPLSFDAYANAENACVSVKGAEGIMNSVTKQYGWAWVDKDDPSIYFPWLFNSWFAQAKIVVAYFAIILWLIKRKDVK